MKKKLLGIFIAISMILSIVSTSAFAISSDWSDAFKSFVLNKKYLSMEQYYGTDNSYSTIQFSMHDFEKDGVPELIIFNNAETMAGMTWYVYRYNGSNIDYTGSIGFRTSAFQYIKNYPGLFFQSGNTGYFPGYYYYVENGILKEELVLTTEEVYNGEYFDFVSNQATANTDLYNACSNSTDCMPEFSLWDIQEMGWECFVRAYTIPKYKQLENVLFHAQNMGSVGTYADINLALMLIGMTSMTNPEYGAGILYPYAEYHEENNGEYAVNAKAGVDWLAKNIFNLLDEKWTSIKNQAIDWVNNSGYYIKDDGENYISNYGEWGRDDWIKSVDSIEKLGDYYFVTYTRTWVFDETDGTKEYAILKLKDFEGEKFWSLYRCGNSPDIKNEFVLDNEPEEEEVTEIHTQEDAVKWIKARKEEAWAQNYDGAGGSRPQCVDLIKYYFDSIVGYSLLGSGYEYVERTDLPEGWYYTQTPSPGDIAVWGKWQGIARGDGHVALVESVGDGTFNYVDVNGTTGLAGKGTIENTNPSAFIHPYFAPKKDISVQVNGNALAFDQPPIIQNDRTLVPLRAIFEALGAIVGWNGDTQTVTATKDRTTVKISIGDNRLFKNDSLIELDVPAQIINDRTLVPVRAISEAFGCKVDWDGNTRNVLIHSN